MIEMAIRQAEPTAKSEAVTLDIAARIATLSPRECQVMEGLVIDYKMPDMNGVELATRLRHRDISAPIILITGYPDENISARAAAAGIRDVLLKPHLEESLVTSIRGAIQDGHPASACGTGH